MKHYLICATTRYSLHADHFGNYTLKRRADSASAFFQGDDADLWSRNMEALLASPALHNLDKSFNFLCSGYDDILVAA